VGLAADSPLPGLDIGDDITFFGFPVPPEALKDHWVVLEEPPAGYRFYAAPQVGPDAATDLYRPITAGPPPGLTTSPMAAAARAASSVSCPGRSPVIASSRNGFSLSLPFV
jgi:hypothetical protein